jgi:predicted nucleic acid-binding protein
MPLVADTTVLIDLWRLRREPARLADLRAKLVEPALPLPVVFEFARGAAFRGVTREKLDNFLTGFVFLVPDYDEIFRAANLDAELRRQGWEIGSADVWIAATALTRGLPVLTANLGHFTRVDGLEVIGYKIHPQS